jgi:rubrerythrin
MWPIKDKSFYRCTVCNDIHFGNMPPKVCPTCGAKNAYVEVDKNEAGKVEGLE